MIKLDSILKKRFKTIGHQLSPVVTVSNKGISENIIAETNRALESHELIKIKLAISDRQERKEIAHQILEKTQSQMVDLIGKVLLCYRAAKKPNAKLSNLLRYLEQTKLQSKR